MIRHWVGTPLPGKEQEAKAWFAEVVAYVNRLAPETRSQAYEVADSETKEVHSFNHFDDSAARDRVDAIFHADEGLMELMRRRESYCSELRHEYLIEMQ